MLQEISQKETMKNIKKEFSRSLISNNMKTESDSVWADNVCDRHQIDDCKIFSSVWN